jgi:hypothetical protein
MLESLQALAKSIGDWETALPCIALDSQLGRELKLLCMTFVSSSSVKRQDFNTGIGIGVEMKPK